MCFGTRVIRSLACIGLAMSCASNAYACGDGLACAVVKQAPDGFAALRRSTTSRSEMLARLTPYEILVVLYSDCRPNRPEDPWTRIECVPRLDGDCKVNQKGTSGWVSSELIQPTECPTNMN